MNQNASLREDPKFVSSMLTGNMLEQNDEWAVQRARSVTLETIGAVSYRPIVRLPVVVA